jgi:PAS domain S-box-containing protein
VQVASKKPVDKLRLRYLPGFAAFIKETKLVDYIRVQLRYSRELNLPLLRFFDQVSEEDMVAMSVPSTTEFMDAIIQNEVRQHIEKAQEKWVANQLDIIDKHDVAAEDITLVSYIRKKAFLAFLPEYTTILADALAIVSEIDTVNAEADTHATATYMKILREKVNEHTHFIERITETSPGIIYVFDIRDEHEVYANKMMTQLLGYEPGDWKRLSTHFVSELIHPDDVAVIEANQQAFATAADGEVRSIRYRIKNKSGEYRWMRTYESIFKRDAEGKPWQVIGIALDIENEKRTADQLKHREKQLLEAQAIANVGSFVWKPGTNEKETTPQFLKIMEMESSEGMDAFVGRVHPADKRSVKTALDDVLSKRVAVDVEFRYHVKDRTKIIWLKATANEDVSQPLIIRGTVMDVTDRNHMLQKLQRSEDINKKAQALTHLGNWTWDLVNNKIELSDELYRIYELEPGDAVSSELIRSFRHPEDAARIDNIIQTSRKTHEPYDLYYRVVLKSGTIKTVHAIGEVLADDKGIAYKMIGTLQDVTEKENLIERLKNSEILYKQAQSLSHIGNWRWNIYTEELEWSDEMYRIYGLEPQSEKITLERLKSFLHPDNRDYVEASILAGKRKEKYDDVFKIIDANGNVKVLHSVAEVQHDEFGKPQYLLGTEQDVTGQEQMVEELQKSRELYKRALEISKIGNWVWDITTNVVEWDEQTYRNFGMKQDDMPVVSFDAYMERIPEEERAKLKQAIDNSIKTHQPYNLIYRLMLPGGRLRYLEAKGRVVLDEAGKVIKLVGTSQDVTDREILIDQLQRSESLYKQAQSLAHLGNWMYDVANDKLFLTDELYRIYGLEPQVTDLGWSSFMEMVHADDRESVSAFVAEVTKTGKPFEMYHRNIRKDDGTTRTLHVRGEGLKDEKGNVYQLFGTTQDVTEQQRIEQELRENQNFIKKIADATPAVITSYNINTGKYRFISQGIRPLLGYEPEEGLEKGVAFFSELIHPDDIVGIMQKNARALETANSPENEDTDIIVDFQYRMKRKDGEYRWFHTFGTVFDRNTQGKVENVLNISIDITDRIRAEETVAEQQRFISHIAEASPTILYLFDLEQQKFLYLNKEVTAVLGYSPEEILSLGNKVFVYLHPEDTIKSADTYVKYKHEGSATMHQFEGRIKSRTGEWKWLLTREVVFKRNEEGKAIQVLGSALDISDRKEMEGSLSKKNTELEQSNANLEEFAYVASHDLQEPLRKISIFGDRLLVNHTENLNDDGKLFLQKIVDSSKRMQAMINDLLSVSLISGNKSFEQYSLKSVLDDVVQTLEFKIEARNAQVYVDDLPVAWIIPSQMRQLFQNLISNSLKFVAKERRPEIRITQSAVKHTDLVSYNLSTTKQYVRINVADNGIGFDNAYASKIFTIFQRLHGKAEYEGTGIGLAICKKIVENHEGVIFAEGKPGEGSVFSIILPV